MVFFACLSRHEYKNNVYFMFKIAHNKTGIRKTI